MGLKQSRVNGVMLDYNGGSELVVDVVSSVFDGYDTASFETGDDRNRFSCIATERKEERVEFIIFGFDLFDDVFFVFKSVGKIHS